MSRGGMCKNPFAGFARPDKIDPQGLLNPHDPPEKAMWMATFLDAYMNYTFFGLGDISPQGDPRGNGTTPENFWFDFAYLFLIRSDRPETWAHARVMTDTSKDEITGRRTTTSQVLSDEQIKLMCADFVFNMMGFGITFDEFVDQIRERRLEILTKDWPQIQAHIRHLRQVSLKQYTGGYALPMFIEDSDVDRRILFEPRSPEEVESVVGYLPKCFKTRRPRRTSPRAFNLRNLSASRRLLLAPITGHRPSTQVFDFREAQRA